MHLRFLISILSFVTLALGAGQVAAQLTPYTLQEPDNTLLQSGEAVTYVWWDKTLDDGALDVFGAIDIMAPPHVIWNIMTDCSRGMDIVKGMKSCDVLETSESGTWDIREQIFDLGILLPDARTRFRSDYEPLKSIKISRVGGDLKRQDGLWSIQPRQDGITRVTYRARIKLKFPVPGGLLKRATRKDTPKIMQNLRRVSETDYAKS